MTATVTKASASAPPAHAQAQKQPKQKKEKVKREKTVRVDYLSVAPGSALTPTGALGTHDVFNQNPPFDPKKHKSLVKKSFANESDYMIYRATQLEARGNRLVAQAQDMKNQARATAEFGDPKKRSQVKRAAKLVSVLKTLTDQLKSQGVDIDAYLAKSQAQAQKA